jgi:hypothetical protein
MNGNWVSDIGRHTVSSKQDTYYPIDWFKIIGCEFEEGLK